MKQTVLLILILSSSSCSKTLKTLDFKSFTIQVPHSWTAVKTEGIDSYVGRIALDSKDTVTFDLRLYSNNLEEDEPTLITKSNIKYFSENDLAEPNVILIEDKDTLLNVENFKRNTTMYKTIDTYKAKLVSRNDGYIH